MNKKKPTSEWPVWEDPDYPWNPESSGVNWEQREKTKELVHFCPAQGGDVSVTVELSEHGTYQYTCPDCGQTFTFQV
jgi:predicted RNA-binding Zn-ribbon protein involved in translation (DUF1610 family)